MDGPTIHPLTMCVCFHRASLSGEDMDGLMTMGSWTAHGLLMSSMDSAAPDFILQNHHLCSGTVSLVIYSKSKLVLKELVNHHYYS